jgi:hypothetical protein
VGLSIFDESQPLNLGLILNAASALAPQGFAVVTYLNSRIDALICVNTDSIDHEVTLTLSNFPSNTMIGRATVPAHAGMGTVPTFELLAAILPSGFQYIALNANTSLLFNLSVVMTGSTELHITPWGGTF